MSARLLHWILQPNAAEQEALLDPVKLKIKDHLDSLPPELSALKTLSRRYLRHCSSIDLSGTIQIAHRPWVAPLNYALSIFPPAKQAWIKRFKGKRIPDPYREVLRASNGLFAFGLTLYGFTPSLQGRFPCSTAPNFNA
jgi:hypothetical protein